MAIEARGVEAALYHPVRISLRSVDALTIHRCKGQIVNKLKELGPTKRATMKAVFSIGGTPPAVFPRGLTDWLRMHLLGALPMSDSASILIVEDETHLCTLLHRSLEREGYVVHSTASGQDALQLDAQHTFDLVVLDIHLPDLDGWMLCRELRRRSDVLILIVSALHRPAEIVRGLELGADDYVGKPFTFQELTAHIQALLRRQQWMQQHLTISTPTLAFHYRSRILRIQDRCVELTAIEHKLLYQLLQQPNQVVSHATLLDAVWNAEPARKPKLLHTTIRRLRLKIEPDPAHPHFIQTVSRIGYKFCLEHSFIAADSSKPVIS